MWMKIAFVAVLGYLLGSINTSIIIGKLKGMDIRSQGSGNAGLTNTLRTFGPSAAVFALVGDVLKGVIACLVGRIVFGWDMTNLDTSMQATFVANAEFGLLIGGLSAVIGHNWPIYFGFKGGKGVLTTVTVIAMMDWKIVLALVLIFVVIVAITRYVSLGSMVAAVVFPFLPFTAWFYRPGYMFLLVACVLSALLILRHIPNIKRLVEGTENKLSFGK